MPIYEYQCAACGHRYDHLQRLSDPDPTVCPSCAASSLKRRVSAPSFRLSGSGWYETDFKSDKESRRNLAGDDGAAPAAKDGDAKPAAKETDKSAATSSDKPAAKPASSESAKTPAATSQPSSPAS